MQSFYFSQVKSLWTQQNITDSFQDNLIVFWTGSLWFQTKVMYPNFTPNESDRDDFSRGAPLIYITQDYEC